MDFSWSPEQITRKEDAIRFAQEELNGDVLGRDKSGEFPRDLWRRCGAFGLQGLHVPRAYGGQGEDLLTTVLTLEGIGYGCRDNGLTFALNAQMWSIQPTILDFASEAQKMKYLPGLCRGELIGCYGMTEPGAGSDAYSLRTLATRVDGGYVLNGEKALITFAPMADFAIIFATTDPAKGKWGLTVFFVDRGTAGFTTGPVQEKMGLRTVPIGRIMLEDCFVPEENRLGADGAGASIFNSSQEVERACILAGQVGAMAYQLEQCIRYAREREQFGRPIAKFQTISNRIAEMKLRLEAARLFLYRAAWLKQAGRPVMLEAALANWLIAEHFVTSSLDAIRIFGGRGYLTENEIERDLRDAVAGPIYGGTADIQRNIIARLLGL